MGKPFKILFAIILVVSLALGGLLIYFLSTLQSPENPPLIDNIDPTVQIISPEDGRIYADSTQLVIIEATDDGVIDAIWYEWNGVNETYTTSINITFNEGLNTINAWANDTSGNVAKESTTFTIYIPSGGDFISRWDTTHFGASNSTQILLPLEESGIYDFMVYWGDETQDHITEWDQPEVNHTYAVGGEYSIRINGTIVGWRFGWGGDCLKLLEIEQWGCLRLGNNGLYFAGCGYLEVTASDIPDLTETTNLHGMFFLCQELYVEGINDWDLSRVTNTSYMFYQASMFDQDISGWNTSSVTDMRWMFEGTVFFNQDISNWDVSSVTTMNHMFESAISFDQDLGAWNVSNVSDMASMFGFITLSNATYDSILIGWANFSPNLQTGVYFSAGNSLHSISTEVLAAKAVLEGTHSWTISDGMPP
ncbi:MAG: DUF285 domain-containing protein [Candidatus Lokiarchaeota archaeon]|nr:DUF285 domain-containing protein [Candidatus Lokiarchaeota archaeon]